MTTKPPVRVILVEDDDGNVVARYREYTCRYLLDDGRTLDVRAARDDSEMRGAVLAFTKANKIEGVAVIATHEIEDVYKPVATRVASRKIPAKRAPLKRA
jgi:hypothetical protein